MGLLDKSKPQGLRVALNALAEIDEVDEVLYTDRLLNMQHFVKDRIGNLAGYLFFTGMGCGDWDSDDSGTAGASKAARMVWLRPFMV